ncbi:MAG: hypothetical protein ACLTRS_14935 [Lachnospiraceae bacterium]
MAANVNWGETFLKAIEKMDDRHVFHTKDAMDHQMLLIRVEDEAPRSLGMEVYLEGYLD